MGKVWRARLLWSLVRACVCGSAALGLVVLLNTTTGSSDARVQITPGVLPADVALPPKKPQSSAQPPKKSQSPAPPPNKHQNPVQPPKKNPQSPAQPPKKNPQTTARPPKKNPQSPARPPKKNPQTTVELIEALYYALEHPEHCCDDLRTFGGKSMRKDGAKLVCMDPHLAPPVSECLVYSFGVASEWSFEEEMVARGCEVHSFDPSINRTEGMTSYGSLFHRTGLFGEDKVDDNGWHMMTLGDHMKKLGHSGRTLDYLKIDVEGSEWSWLDAEDDDVLRRVRQLEMEIHFFDLRAHYYNEKAMTEALDMFYTTFEFLKELGFCLVSATENSISPGRLLLPGLGVEKATLFEVLWVKR